MKDKIEKAGKDNMGKHIKKLKKELPIFRAKRGDY